MKKRNKRKDKKISVLLAAGAAAVLIFLTVCTPAPLLRQTADSTPAAPAAAGLPSYEPLPETTAPITPSPVTTASPVDESPTPVPTPVPIEANEITNTLTVNLSGGASTEFLSDGDVNTKRTLNEGTSINIISPQPIHSIYMIWDRPPGKWSLSSADDTGAVHTSNYGEEDFAHEYITLTYPAEEITIFMSPEGAVLCDIYAFSEGYPPRWVQTWLPPLDKADLLVIPTHADDEHLFFVGTMPYYAGEMGYDVQVAYMTNHWNEPPRIHELLDGLWIVGIRNYPVISGFNDRYTTSLEDARSIYGFDNIVNFHVELLRRFKPSVVVGHDLNGEYGHGAHMLNAHALRSAAEYASDPQYHTSSAGQYGTWDTPKLYLHLYDENSITMNWDIPLNSFDGASAREMAMRGYEQHVSQHRWGFAVPLPDSGRTGSVFGLVRSTVGPDVIGGDMFENIVR